MSRTPLPLAVADVSALARSLRSQLAGCDGLPSHLEMLNILVRASGFRNFQHFRVEAAQAGPIPARRPGAASEQAAPPPATGGEADARDAGQAPAVVQGDTAPPGPGREESAAPVNPVRLGRLIRHFDSEGRLIRWPGKFSLRGACLWVLWSRLPSGKVLNETQVNDLLRAAHTFGDHALLRRELFDAGLVARTPDGREYRRVEQRPTPEALALFRALGELRQA